MSDKERNLGGKPTIKQQAKNRHEEGEARYNLAMGKLLPDAIKKFEKLYKEEYDNLKHNQQLALIQHVFSENKEFRKKIREEEAQKAVEAMKDAKQEIEDDDQMPIIDISGSTTPKTLS